MVVANNEIDATNNAGKSTTILMTCGCGGAMWGALPDESHPGLHSKPLDFSIRRVLASHCRGGHHG